MKPNFALNMTHEGIELLHRAPRGGWTSVGEVKLDDPGFRENLSFLRRTAVGLEGKGFCSKLILPLSEILYLDVTAPGPGETERRAQIMAALEGQTPYDVADLTFDWTGEGEVVRVAVVANETLDEAEVFAVEHRFNPVSFVGTSDPDAHPWEPYFGRTDFSYTIIDPDEDLRDDPADDAGKGKAAGTAAQGRAVSAGRAGSGASSPDEGDNIFAAGPDGGEAGEGEDGGKGENIFLAADEPDDEADEAPDARAGRPGTGGDPGGNPGGNTAREPLFSHSRGAAGGPRAPAGEGAAVAPVPTFSSRRQGSRDDLRTGSRPLDRVPHRIAIMPAETEAADDEAGQGAGQGASDGASDGGSQAAAKGAAGSDASARKSAPEGDRGDGPDTKGQPDGTPDEGTPKKGAQDKGAPDGPLVAGTGHGIAARDHIVPQGLPGMPKDRPASRGPALAGLLRETVTSLSVRLKGAMRRRLPERRPEGSGSESTGSGDGETAPGTEAASAGLGGLFPDRPDNRRGRALFLFVLVAVLVVGIGSVIYALLSPPGSEGNLPGMGQVGGKNGATPVLSSLTGADNADRRSPAEQGADRTDTRAPSAGVMDANGRSGDKRVLRPERGARAGASSTSGGVRVGRILPPRDNSPAADAPSGTVAATTAGAENDNRGDKGATPGTGIDKAQGEAPAIPVTRLSPQELADIRAAGLPPPTPEELAEGAEAAMTPEELQAAWKETGALQGVTEPLAPPANPERGDIFVAGTDRDLEANDAIILPDFRQGAGDFEPAPVPSPPPPGTSFALDARGLVTPTAAGVLNPDGVLVYAGKPKLAPPLRPRVARADLPDPLRRVLPRPRPAGLSAAADAISARERVNIARLRKFRPRARPLSAQQAVDAAVQSVSQLAVLTSFKPPRRPAGFSGIVRKARIKLASTRPANARAGAPAAQPLPGRLRVMPGANPTVARHSTVRGALNLNQLNLIGVYGTSDRRSALLRLPSGRYVKVRRGSRVAGGQVAAIGRDFIRYVKNGRNRMLKIPSRP